MAGKKGRSGGHRKGAGRKTTDKVKKVDIYVKQSRITALGKDKIKVIAKQAVEDEYNKLK